MIHRWHKIKYMEEAEGHTKISLCKVTQALEQTMVYVCQLIKLYLCHIARF